MTFMRTLGLRKENILYMKSNAAHQHLDPKTGEFTGNTIPPYAIVSHPRVEGQEITLHDSVAPNEFSKTKSGLAKAHKACRVAAQDGFGW